MNMADILLTFRDTQDIAVLRINSEDANIEALNVIAIEILSWLKLEQKRVLWQEEGKKTKLKPLRLNMQYSWCKYLKELLKCKNVFSDVLTIVEDDLRFRDDIAEDYRSAARETAFYQYNPQKII